MNDFMRNRLIGVITILLIIVIFFPYIGKKKSFLVHHTFSLTSSNDKFPLEETAAAKEPSPQVKQDEIPSLINSVTQEESRKTPLSLITSNSGTTGDKSYVIQLVALKNKKKVEELSALLRLNNYQTYIDPENAGTDQIIRLLVGPYHAKQQVESALIDLNKLTKLKGIMITK